MTALTNQNTVAAVIQAHPRVSKLLQLFSYDGAGWEDYPSMNDPLFLQYLKLDLDTLSAAVEARIQEVIPHEPIELANNGQEGI